MHGINFRYFSIYFCAIVSSVAISIWSGVSGSIVNTDGICYLQSAESLSQGLNAAMHVCDQARWPFYSILIAGVVYLSKISYVSAAYFLNGVLSIISAVIFVKIVLFISQSATKIKAQQGVKTDSARDQSLLWFAVIVILFSNEFNSVKYYIIRDHGFWAFYLLSLFFLLHFFQNQRWLYSIGWCFSLMIATLFRIEGAVFLMMLPFFIFFNGTLPFFSRVKAFFKLNALLILLCLCLSSWIFIAAPDSLGRLSEIPLQFTQGFSRLVFDFKMRADHLSQYVLSHYSARYSSWVLLITLIVWYFVSVVKNVSLIYSILAVYAWSKNLLKASHATQWVLWGYLIVNILITTLFLAEHMFLSKRYLIALSLVVMIWAPFALQDLFVKWKQRKLPIALALILIAVTSLGGFFEFGHSKKYIYNAGSWLSQNTPSDSKIFSNDVVVMYYSHRFGNELFEYKKTFKNNNTVLNGKWKQYDYLALRINKKDLENGSPLIQEINAKPIQIFANKRGDQVRIYKSKL